MKLHFFNKVEKFNGTFSQLEENNRRWEKLYRQRWAHDKVVRTTHGVNCTGSCSWNVYVKQGIITWEHQATDYPSCGVDIPGYEPRGCPRGASFSWYEYSPVRIKYPYVRQKLWKLWTEARKEHDNLVDAWASIVEDPEKSKEYKAARGHGGLIRVHRQEALELISISMIYTIKKYGPDRIAGFSPIPAMSMASFSAGARFMSLIGGEELSFYDWYADLPPASPQVWGEQTDVPESAEWYNSSYIIMWGSNIPLTRTPDAHFMTEARYKGAKIVAVSPDYAENVKFADDWLAPKPGSDSALAQAMTYVILDEFYQKHPVKYFIDYSKNYTDLPFLVELEESTANHDHFTAGRFVRINDLVNDESIVNPAWKTVVFDQKSQKYVVPNGTMGQKYNNQEKWNLELKDQNGNAIDPALSMMDQAGFEEKLVDFPAFSNQGNSVVVRHLPVKQIKFADGSLHYVTNVYDLMMSQMGINRTGHDELAAKDAFDKDSYFTPAWQETRTGVKAMQVVQIAREFAQNAAQNDGASMVIMGGGINHWYNAEMNYRTIMNMLMLCGCVGKTGGGWAHYVGQEKLRPSEGWANITFANDWEKGGCRQMQGTTWYYFATDQWKYEEIDNKAQKSPVYKSKHSYLHNADYTQMAIRLGWLPSYPQFDRSSLSFVNDYNSTDLETISKNVVKELKAGTLHFAAEDPDKNKNQPKVFMLWRSNLFASSGKGAEYFMKHLLGTENGLLAKPNERIKPEDMIWRNQAAVGKLDMVVDIDFRMVSTPMLSDVVLPAATWYEKEDLSSTDMHPFIHPFNAAISPMWESKSDWQHFKLLAKEFSRLAKKYLPIVEYDLKTNPLGHDTVGELAQPYGEIKDWKKGEIEPIPGKTMPSLKLIKRDYTKIYEKFITLGPNVLTNYPYEVKDQYEYLKEANGVCEEGVGKGLPLLDEDRKVCEAILRLSTASNGKLAYRAWKGKEKKTGEKLADIGQGHSENVMSFESITAQPQEAYPTPTGTSSKHDGDRYTPFSLMTERKIPNRTLTGRQQFYIDHETFREYGEGLATYKPSLPPIVMAPSDVKVEPQKDELTLKYMTPHGKWNIHTMYYDNLEMLTLFRGGPTIWMSPQDAEKINIKDNDWIEAYNRNGVVTARAVVSVRMPEGSMYMYHAQDNEIYEPLSTITGNRGGSHNAPTQIHIKPTHMVGGYAQLSYAWNYYGPTGNQRDLYANVRKLKKVRFSED